MSRHNIARSSCILAHYLVNNFLTIFVIIQIINIFVEPNIAAQKAQNKFKRLIMGTIQNNIKAIRKKLGYTQETVADVLGIGRTTYTEYETKDIDIPFGILEKLSDFFGVELTSFFVENENQLKDALVYAFRTDGISVDDLRKITRFKSIVKNYIKMQRIER